jgi:hypothetical protein
MPEEQALIAGSQVTFVSECGEHEVYMSFSNPSTLFTSGAQIIRLRDKGERKSETISSQGGCHQLCFGTPTCPSDDRESKTGSLDVYPSGGPGPGPSNAASP